MYKRKYSATKFKIEKTKEKFLAAIINPVGGEKNGASRVTMFHKMTMCYLSADSPLQLLSQDTRPVSAWEKTKAASLPSHSEHPHWASGV